MDIRRLVPADAPAYRALRLRGLREHPQAFTSSWEEDQQLPLAATVSRLQGESLHSFWGAFDGPALGGTVGLAREARVKNRHKGTVVGMYVAPEAAGRGAGRALLQALLEDARRGGLELLLLTVTEGNDSALHLYRQVGFTSFGVEPDAIRVDGRSFGKNHMYLRMVPS